MAEDGNGYLWLASQQGLFRFDGNRLLREEAFPFASASSVVSMRNEIYVGGKEGLARRDGLGFKILTKEPITGLASFPDYLYFSTLEALYLLRRTDLIERISVDGDFRRGFHFNSDRELFYFGRRSGELIRFATQTQIPETIIEPRANLKSLQWQPAANGGIWLADSASVQRIEAGQVRETFTVPSNSAAPKPLSSGRNGDIWYLKNEPVLLDSDSKVFWPDFLRSLLPSASAPSATGRHVWFALPGFGVIRWVVNPELRWWEVGHFQGNHVVQIVASSSGDIYAASHGNLHRLSKDSFSWQPLSKTGLDFYAILAIPNDQFLAVLRKQGLVRMNRDGRILETLTNQAAPQMWFRFLSKDGAGRIWVASIDGLHLLDGPPGHYRLAPQQLPKVTGLVDAYVSDIEIDPEGNPWAGFKYGVAFLDQNQQWKLLDTDRPISAVRSLAVTNDEIWVAHREPGYFTRIDRKTTPARVQEFHSSSGFTPADTFFMKRSPQGQIMRGASDALHTFLGPEYSSPGNWLTINRNNGLQMDEPSLRGYFIHTQSGVWICGSGGVQKLPLDFFHNSENKRIPRFSRVLLDGQEVLPSDSFKGSRLTLEFDNLRKSNDPAIEARSTRLGTWRHCPDLACAFQDLPPGAHSLEFRYSALGGNALRTINFQSVRAQPPIYLSFGFWAFTLTGLVSGASIWRSKAARKFRYQSSKRRFLKKLPAEASLPPSLLELPNDFPNGLTVLGHLASGGFSNIYECLGPPPDHRRLAVKRIWHNAEHSAWQRRRFLAEVAALQSISHPNIIPLLDWFIHTDASLCLVMPLIEGSSLREKLGERLFSPSEAVQIMRALISALDCIHQRGVIHRDLKPENILIPNLPPQEPIILDFGLAGLRGIPSQATETTFVAGSLSYMSPELLMGHYSEASDLYSLACIHFELLTRQKLNSIALPTLHQDFLAVMTESLARCGISDAKATALATAIAAALHPHPDERPRLKDWLQMLDAANKA